MRCSPSSVLRARKDRSNRCLTISDTAESSESGSGRGLSCTGEFLLLVKISDAKRRFVSPEMLANIENSTKVRGYAIEYDYGGTPWWLIYDTTQERSTLSLILFRLLTCQTSVVAGKYLGDRLRNGSSRFPSKRRDRRFRSRTRGVTTSRYHSEFHASSRNSTIRTCRYHRCDFPNTRVPARKFSNASRNVTRNS